MTVIANVKPGETIEIRAAVRVERPTTLSSNNNPLPVALGKVEPPRAVDPSADPIVGRPARDGIAFGIATPRGGSCRMRWIAAATIGLTLFSAVLVHAQPGQVATQAGPVNVENVATGLVHPWGMAFLPDGRLLVTERPGRLRILHRDGQLSQPLAGTPEVFARGQGGLLDVAVDPEFAKNRLIYLSFSEPGSGGASTALGRGRLAEDRIEGFQVIFRQEPKVSGPNHFGSRIGTAS